MKMSFLAMFTQTGSREAKSVCGSSLQGGSYVSDKSAILSLGRLGVHVHWDRWGFATSSLELMSVIISPLCERAAVYFNPPATQSLRDHCMTIFELPLNNATSYSGNPTDNIHKVGDAAVVMKPQQHPSLRLITLYTACIQRLCAALRTSAQDVR